MNFLKKTRPNLKRLKRDESGSMAIAWALSIATMFGVIAAATDLAMLHSADTRAQHIADTTALAAAIFVRDNERIPNSREEGFLGEYTADELGYEFRSWVDGGAAGVNVNIVYDDVNREAKVSVSGNTKPTILQAVGADLAFYSESTVKYQETDFLDPASVVLILDNSGSMFFDDTPLDLNGNRPDGTRRRIDGLEQSAEDMMALLHSSAGPQDPDGPVPAVLRTGMLPFSDVVISDTEVPMKWGRLTAKEITDMEPDGATDSSVPLERADGWLDNEDAFHRLETPGKTPLKFVVLMSDGQNTVGIDNPIWVAREGTQDWRRYVTGRPTADGLDPQSVIATTVQIAPETCSTTTQDRWFRICQYSSNGFNFSNEFGPFSDDPGPLSGTFDANFGTRFRPNVQTVTFNCSAENRVQESETCTPAQFGQVFEGFEYVLDSPDEPPLGSDGVWEEGEFDIQSNIDTLRRCEAMKDKGIDIYTIAFALQPGAYRTNDWGVINNRPNGADFTFQTTVEAAATARRVLEDCATDQDNFITANDTTSLNEAFERIGNDIIQEIIRISG